MKVLIVDTSFRYQPTLYDITIAQYGVITSPSNHFRFIYN